MCSTSKFISEQFIEHSIKEDIELLAELAEELIQAMIAQGQEPMPLEDVMKKLTNEDMNFMLQFSLELRQWLERKAKADKIKEKILATAMIKFRLVKDPDTFDCKTLQKELDNQGIYIELVEKLAEFATKERNNWKTPDELSTLNDEELKKRLNL